VIELIVFAAAALVILASLATAGMSSALVMVYLFWFFHRLYHQARDCSMVEWGGQQFRIWVFFLGKVVDLWWELVAVGFEQIRNLVFLGVGMFVFWPIGVGWARWVFDPLGGRE